MSKSPATRAAALFAALTLGVGCSDAAPEAPKATPPNTSNAKASPAASPATAAQATPQAAAKQDGPEALVSELYRAREKNQGPFFQTKSRALVDKFFVKGLADSIWKDAVDSQGEVGALGADPLYDTQDDSDLKNLAVGGPVEKEGRAEVPVTFENFGKRRRLVYLLVREGAAWKISDIRYEDGRTLSEAYKEQ